MAERERERERERGCGVLYTLYDQAGSMVGSGRIECNVTRWTVYRAPTGQLFSQHVCMDERSCIRWHDARMTRMNTKLVWRRYTVVEQL